MCSDNKYHQAGFLSGMNTLHVLFCLLAGLEDEQSWADAVLDRRGDQGLLQAHAMVERALGRKFATDAQH
jgi:hypothetical protein